MIDEHFNTAEEFIEALRITNDKWLPQDREWESRWLFRGQRNAEWKLIPHAWRQGNLDPFQKFKDYFRSEATGYFHGLRFEYKGKTDDSLAFHSREANSRWIEIALQQAAEIYAVQEFAHIANRVGHPVPDGDAAYSHPNRIEVVKFLLEAPMEAIKYFARNHTLSKVRPDNSAYALAQHHGIATRLLDWTEDGLMAAFFAAQGVKPDDSYKIAVWALRKDALTTSSLELVDRPRADISYLNAQKGLFTYDTQGGYHFLKYGQWPDVLSAQYKGEQLRSFQFTQDDLRKLTLPASECGKLLRLLWIEGISQAHLMPTYDNVAIALKTRGKWRQY